MGSSVASRVDNTNDIIDSRDILERIEDLEGELSGVDCDTCGGFGRIMVAVDEEDGTEQNCEYCGGHGTVDLSTPGTLQSTADEYGMLAEVDELATLRKLVEEIDQSAGDNARDGVALIRDAYFEEYAQEEASDIYGKELRESTWPFCHIDWTAAVEALQQDYSTVDYDGETYWVRS